MTLSEMTLSIMALDITKIIQTFSMLLSIIILGTEATKCYTKKTHLTLSVVMLGVIMLSDVYAEWHLC